MATSRPPTRLFHFTEVSNLASVLRTGLYADQRVRTSGIEFTETGNADIKTRRRGRPIDSLGCTVGDCVPFYFAPRSPMLYRVWDRGRGVDQNDIVYLCTTAEDVIRAGLTWAASDRNAVLGYAAFSTNYGDLETLVDWGLMESRMWNDTDTEPDRKERRMAEFLVRDSVPTSLVSVIGCRNERVARVVRGILSAHRRDSEVIVRPGWYF